jgi:cytochrome P450
VLTILDPAEHNQRRRIWDRGFSATALKSYEPMLDARVSQLSAALEGRVGEPVDLAQWIGFMTLDFMGDFSLNGQFDFLARGEDAAGFHEFIIKAVTRLELLGAIPWIRPFVLALPRVGLKAFQEFSLRVVKSRIENGSKYRDIFYYLVSRASIGGDFSAYKANQLNEDGEGSHAPLTLKSLTTEASLAIIAGSDTTSAALANAIVYLLANPYHLTRLRAELDAAAGEGAVYDVDIEADKLAHLEYLQAIINETLRLMPAMPHGAQRMPPQDGGAVLVAGQYDRSFELLA